jgi:predicted nucleic acid-binding protein
MVASSDPTSSASPYPLLALFDTNVVLDWVLNRKPWSDDAIPLWQASDAGKLIIYVPASVLTDIFYVVRHERDANAARMAVSFTLSICAIVPVHGRLLSRAYSLNGKDFEDDIVIACAEAARLDVIVTRNPRDFQNSPIRVLEPAELVRLLPEP